MPTDPARDTAESDDEVPPSEGQPANGDVHGRLARHGFLVSNDFPDFRDPEGDDELASTMLSVIESMLATPQVGELPAAETDGDDTAGPSPSKPSTSS